MNLREYPVHYKTVGKLNLFIGGPADEFEPEWEAFAVKAIYAGTDENELTVLMNTLCAIQWRAFKKQAFDSRFSIDVAYSKCKHPYNNTDVAEFGIELSFDDDLTEAEVIKIVEEESNKIQFNTVIGAYEPDFSNVKFSLSCAYKKGNHSFVKVRFNRNSIEFHFNKDGWMRKQTIEDIKDKYNYSKPELIKPITELLEREQVNLLERARAKVVNESGIGESTPIELHLVKKLATGSWSFITSKDALDPKAIPAFVLEEYNGEHHYLVDSNNKIYSVTSFRHKSDGYEQAGDKKWIGSDPIAEGVRILPSAVKSTTVDEYTKKRIERAIKRKL